MGAVALLGAVVGTPAVTVLTGEVASRG
jgi:hypothetical protein